MIRPLREWSQKLEVPNIQRTPLQTVSLPRHELIVTITYIVRYTEQGFNTGYTGLKSNSVDCKINFLTSLRRVARTSAQAKSTGLILFLTIESCTPIRYFLLWNPQLVAVDCSQNLEATAAWALPKCRVSFCPLQRCRDPAVVRLSPRRTSPPGPQCLHVSAAACIT